MKSKRKKPDLGALNCAECNASTPRNCATQRYCPACSEQRDAARKQKYHVERGRKIFQVKRDEATRRGSAVSAATRISVDAWKPYLPALAWYVRVEMPFAWAGSKNHLFATTSRGHTFLRDEARFYRTELTERIFEATRNLKIYKNKLWLDVLVQKPNHRGDAANFVDLICDAVKDAIPLDDRWYAIRTLDWQVCKRDPAIFIGLGQEAEVDVQACSTCGRLLPFDAFQKNRAALNGVTRVCKTCLSLSPRDRRGRRRFKLEGVFA